VRTLALWELAHGRIDEADAAARRAVEVSHEGAGALLVLGRVEMEKSRYAQAADAFSRAIAAWPADWGSAAYLHFLLGNALQRLGRTEEAATELASGRGEAPPLPDPWRGEVQDLREGFETRLMRVHHLLVSDRRDAAEAAIAALQELRRGHPDNVQVLTDLGSAYLFTSRWGEAVAVLSEAVEKHPNALDPRLQLSRALWASGRRDDAMRHAQIAVETNPQSADALEARGLMFLRASRGEAALADFVSAGKLDPASASAPALAGAAELTLSHPDAARAHFEAALRLDAAQATAIAGLAIVALNSGDAAAADRHLARIAGLRDDAAPLVADARRQRAMR
jgi:tetratricopeptide (TPR) repeat protein